MEERASRLYRGLVTLRQWESVSCVLDIGGSNGAVLSSLLEANLLCSVLHDWEDEAAREILQRSAQALPRPRPPVHL